MRTQSVGARRRREDRRSGGSAALLMGTITWRNSRLCASVSSNPLHPPPHSSSLSLSFIAAANLVSPPRFTSTWGLIIPTRAFSLYTCARLCLSYAWDPPTETMHPLLFFAPATARLLFLSLFFFSSSLSPSSSIHSPFFPFVLSSLDYVRYLSRQIVITRNNLQ